MPHMKPGTCLVIPQRVLDRIWGRLAPPDANGCRRFIGARVGKDGQYGNVGWYDSGRGVGTTAHRVAYTATHGPIPDGYEVDHICFVTDCCTPEHLQLLTTEENARRQPPRGWRRPPPLPPAERPERTHCPQGHALADHGRPRRKGGKEYVYCRTCHIARMVAYRRRKVASQAG